MVELLDPPPPVTGKPGYGIDAAGEQSPQVFGRADPAGVTARHPDDGDRLRWPFFQLP
jgi:hypothetical protein